MAAALPAAAYGLASLAGGVWAVRRGVQYLLTVPLALATIALGFGLGFLLGPARPAKAPVLSAPVEGSHERS